MAPAGAFAQVVEVERQDEVLPDRGILEISRDLRQRLGLFPEVQAFRTARLFLRADGRAVLEIESGREGELRRERRLLEAGELASFRADLEARMEAAGVRAVVTREGRGGLVLGQTLIGLAYHGWAVPVALDLDTAQGVVAAYLLTAGASFYVPFHLTRTRGVSDAHRDLTIYGGTRGIVTGLLLGDLLAGDRDGDGDGRVQLAGGVALGAAGSFLGFHSVDRWAPAEGTAALWRALGDAGLGVGAALAYALGPYASEDVVRRVDGFEFVESRRRNPRLGHAIALAGQGAGLAAGGWLGSGRDYSRGDASALRSATVLGAQVGATVVRATGVESARSVTGGAVAGALAGTLGGDLLLARRNLGAGEGLLVNAGHLAGGATALGLTYLIVEEIDERPVLYLATSTLGSLLGAGLVWRAVTPPRARAVRSPGGPAGFELFVHPGGLAAGLVAGDAAGTGPRSALPPPPLVTIRF